MYFPFLPTVNCYQDLHQLTKASTYYEFFNLNENCKDSEITKAFRRLKKALPPAHLSKETFDELVMNGYSILANYRKAYDGFLADSKYIYITDSKNFKNYIVVVAVALVCLLVFIDFVVYAFRYLRYAEADSQYKKAKKSDAHDSKAKKAQQRKPPMMISHRMIRNFSRVFTRR